MRMPDYDVQVVPYEKHKALMSIRGEISRETPSLIAAVNAAGESIGLALEFAQVFEGEVDFANELQPGDSFELLFEKVVREGEFGGYGDIVAARFTTSGRSFEAFRYAVPGQKADYYDRDGRSMRRFFLKSPLKFEPRVTSGFSFRRVHPVLRTARAHRGVDYGAPHGAPVLSVASGTVVRAGWTGGGGNSVYIRHDSGYETRYLHFSRIASGIRAGVRVSQGEHIGNVGSTGLSTGAHLHYELLKGGTHVNPLDEHRKLPPGQPIPEGRWPPTSSTATVSRGALRARPTVRSASWPARPPHAAGRQSRRQLDTRAWLRRADRSRLLSPFRRESIQAVSVAGRSTPAYESTAPPKLQPPTFRSADSPRLGLRARPLRVANRSSPLTNVASPRDAEVTSCSRSSLSGCRHPERFCRAYTFQGAST